MSLLGPVLLSFLPHTLTTTLLPYLSAYLPQLFPPAAQGSAGYRSNYRWAFTSLVALYLAWTLLGITDGQDDNWYAVLGAKMNVGDDGLKRAFRLHSRTYHPDRAGLAGESRFILLRTAYEGLSDPLKRDAYDRFGPDVIHWKCLTLRECIRRGAVQSSGFYIVSTGIIILLTVLGRAREGAFWRNFLLVCLAAVELHLILTARPVSLPFVHRQPPFLQIRLLHRLFTTASVGFNQLAAVWAVGDRPSDEAVWNQIRASVRGLELEAVGAFQETVVPLLSHGDALHIQTTIKAGMEEALIDRATSSHPHIRPFWLDAISRAKGSRETSRRAAQDLEVARQIPLPPSPPPSPILRPQYSV